MPKSSCRCAFGAPQRAATSRRRAAGRCADDLEELADEALGGPAGEADAPSGAAHAQQLGRRPAWSGVNITPKVESDRVEARVGERERLRVGHPVGDRAAPRPWPGPRTCRAAPGHSRSRSPRRSGARRRGWRCRCRPRRPARARRRACRPPRPAARRRSARVVPITAKSPLAHVVCCFFLIASKSGVAAGGWVMAGVILLSKVMDVPRAEQVGFGNDDHLEAGGGRNHAAEKGQARARRCSGRMTPCGEGPSRGVRSCTPVVDRPGPRP